MYNEGEKGVEVFENALSGYTAAAKEDLENRIAWFYLWFLTGVEDQQLLSAASAGLHKQQLQKMPPAKGEWEAKAQARSYVTKKDYLLAQIRDVLEGYADQFCMTEQSTPAQIRKALDKQADAFVSSTLEQISAELYHGLMRGEQASEMAEKTAAIFTNHAKRFEQAVEESYIKSSWCRILDAYEQQGYQKFRFEMQVSQGSCERCISKQKQEYTVQQILEQGLLPPLHPNCNCRLVPVETGAGKKPETSTGNGAGALEELKKWGENLSQIPSDAKAMLDSFLEGNAARYEAIEGIWDLPALMDYITLGSVKGFFEGQTDRWDRMLEDPDLYHVGDFFSLGTLDLLKNAIFPQKAFSLEHWLNIAGASSLLSGGYQLAKQNAARKANEPSAQGSKKPSKDTAGDQDGVQGKGGSRTGKLDGLTADERKMIDDLLNSGKNVEVIPRSDTAKMPDYDVNDVKIE